MKSVDTFDKLVNVLLEENYFGGSPYERESRIKKHVTFEESSDHRDLEQEGELARELRNELDQVAPYGYGDKSGNPEAQSEMDDILHGFLEGLDLVKVGRSHNALGEMIVYSIPDDLKDEFKPYTIVANSTEDLGDATELFPLDRFYSVMIGTPIGERGGVPILKNKFYDGPAQDIKSLSNKEPEGQKVTGHAPGRLDYDQIKADVEAAKKRGMMR